MLKKITIQGAKQHNLKNINLTIPRDKLIVITGLSGSGKSTLAFNTIYAEGQRRYIESLNTYARQFLKQLDKPAVEKIEGLSPAIAIEQKTNSNNPRSTVGTITEIYDYLRLLFARVGIPFCPKCRHKIQSHSSLNIAKKLVKLREKTEITLIAPIIKEKKGEHKAIFAQIIKKGFGKIRVNGNIFQLPNFPNLEKNKKHTLEIIIDRIFIEKKISQRLLESIETCLKLGKGSLLVDIKNRYNKKQETKLFSEKLSCEICGFSLPEITPQIFSFNSPRGVCPYCNGLGQKMNFNEKFIIPNKNLSINKDAILPWIHKKKNYRSLLLKKVASFFNINLDKPWLNISEKIQKKLLYGSNEIICFQVKQNNRKYMFQKQWEGIIPTLEREYKKTSSTNKKKDLEKYMNFQTCPFCKGARLKKLSLSIKIENNNIWQITKKSIRDALNFFLKIKLSSNKQIIAEKILKEIKDRLNFMINVGLDYLTLNRASNSLSGGESQRIKLATQVGSALVGVLYVLDEPSIGLHQKDNKKLLKTLKNMRDLGNTIIVVEHDKETIENADFIVDMGPGAGNKGGKVVFSGPPQKLLRCKESLTGQYLINKIKIPIPKKRREINEKYISINGCKAHNLKNINVKIPIGVFSCITGVSGSGKSSLIIETLYKNLIKTLNKSKEKAGKIERIKGFKYIKKVINIDQNPIGRTPRSNPATYTGIFTTIRELFSTIPEARSRGYKAERFSFNLSNGRCPVCRGEGVIKIEMHFLPNVHVTCETCKGLRYKQNTLEIKYKNKNINDILNMSCSEAYTFFKNVPSINSKLKILANIGLDYIKLGQPATTLSGGEAQRIKLSKELSKKSKEHTLYILDEPTTGLHFDDIKKLLKILNKLIEKNNTVVVIEHNLEVIKTADHIIDMGPEGGEKGGEIIATGTPEKISQKKRNHTAKYLKEILSIQN